MSAKVECYSGHTYAQEPRAFFWAGWRFVVQAIERTWRVPSGPCFLVRTEDGRYFQLHYNEAQDEWQIYPEEK